MVIHSYRDLIVWKKAMDFVNAIYIITEKFPQEEEFGLRSQMRRAAVSIPSNIAEGSYRATRKEFRHFILHAFSSGAEIETQLELAKRLYHIPTQEYNKAHSLLNEIMRMLNRLRYRLE